MSSVQNASGEISRSPFFPANRSRAGRGFDGCSARHIGRLQDASYRVRLTAKQLRPRSILKSIVVARISGRKDDGSDAGWAGDHASFEAWLDAEKLLSAAQARKLIDIVAHVPREEALAVGQERAYALIALSRATPEPDSAAELIAQGVVDGRPAAEASVRAIKAATKAQRDQAPPTPRAQARRKADVALEKGVRATLRAAGVAVTAVRVGTDAVRVELPRAKLEKALAKG